MKLEDKILELYNKEYSSVKVKKIIGLLKVVLVDNETDLYEIEKKVPIGRATIKKYILDKNIFVEYITEEEYELFLRKINLIYKTEKEQEAKEELTLIARIIDDILNSKKKLSDICAENFFKSEKFKKIMNDTNYIDDNFGIGVKEKVQLKIEKNGKDRLKVPRNMFFIEDRYHLFIAKKDIVYLDEFDYKRLSYASDYLCSGANMDFVIKKHEVSIIAALKYLNDPKLENILKEEHLETLRRYVEIENLLLNNNLARKKEVVYEFVECLYESKLNKNDVIEKLGITDSLFNKLLNEVIKMSQFSFEIRKDVKNLLDEEKKVK